MAVVLAFASLAAGAGEPALNEPALNEHGNNPASAETTDAPEAQSISDFSSNTSPVESIALPPPSPPVEPATESVASPAPAPATPAFTTQPATVQSKTAPPQSARPATPRIAQPAAPQEAPDFALRTLENRNLRLSEFRGEVVLINFWASWCGACRQAMPSLNDMYNKYHRAGLIMLSVNVNDELHRAGAMAKSLKIPFPVLLDDQRDVGRAFRIEQMPTTLLIDRAGTIRHRYVGYNVNDEQKILAGLRELLNE